MPQATRPLRATYRLQVHKDFTLVDVREIVPYLANLGISHIYTSPILKARPGSTHGYDVADPKTVNPELGGEDAFRALVKELHAHELGYILDIVPNHMGTGSSNPYWEDVLANGRESIYGHWFDIDWESPDAVLRGRVLLPVLGDELDAVLGRGELSIGRVEDHGGMRVKYFDNSFPLSPETVEEIGTGAIEGKREEDRRRLRAILDRQHYSLVSWRRASKDINYRRFFDINELVALRMEDPSVFEETHARILEWVADGSLDGLRIDHIDGLLHPQAYLERLRAEVTERRGREFPIYVEKILSPGEQLRRSWPVDGTTGYEILNDLEAVMIDDRGFAVIEEAYRKLMRPTGETLTFEQMAIDGKIAILRGSLSPDITRLTRLLVPIAKSAGALVTQGAGDGGTPGRRAGDSPRRGSDGAGVDEEALRDAIIELIACLPVYRTYIDGADGKVPEEDVKVLEQAFTRARERGAASGEALDLLSDVLRPTAPVDDPADRAARQLFIRRFQQTSGPATAKGVEDTGLYLYMPLVSRNEVGGSPDRPLDVAIPTLHEANGIRAEQWPRNLVCSNTHDTKRSADVRARLDVLAEMPEQWMSSVRRWRMLNKSSRVAIGRRTAPDPNTEYLFYQTLLGVWPHDYEEGEYPQSDEMEALHKRVEAYMLKAVKEGKSRSNWTDPDEQFETAMKNFINTTIFRSPTFLSDFAQLASRTSRPGLWNALTRTVLHLTVPGVPDIYQGGELFNFALVDPDNRRPVDYDVRREELEDFASRDEKDDGLIEELVSAPENGRAKMHVFRSVLKARRERFDLFARGAYLPLEAEGPESRHVIAFARTHGREAAVVVAPRLPAGLTGGEGAPIGAGVWGETALALPASLAGRTWTCAITGRAVSGEGGQGIPIGEILATFPVALLVARHEG